LTSYILIYFIAIPAAIFGEPLGNHDADWTASDEPYNAKGLGLLYIIIIYYINLYKFTYLLNMNIKIKVLIDLSTYFWPLYALIGDIIGLDS